MYLCMYLYSCMYVCMYVRKYVCIYVCVYACIFVCMYVCLYMSQKVMTHGSQGHERATKQRYASRKSKIHNHTCLGILIATLQSPQDTRENGYQYLIPTCEGLQRLVTCVGHTTQSVCFFSCAHEVKLELWPSRGVRRTRPGC